VREIADEKGITPGQLALAWLLAQGEEALYKKSPLSKNWRLCTKIANRCKEAGRM
jgi:hypothetical protein